MKNVKMQTHDHYMISLSELQGVNIVIWNHIFDGVWVGVDRNNIRVSVWSLLSDLEFNNKLWST